MLPRTVRTPEDAINATETILGRPPRVLDFGAGHARLMGPRLQAGNDIYGVDNLPDEVMAGRARLVALGIEPDRLQTLDGSGRSRFDDASFDLVYSEDVFEHVVDVDTVVRELARVTRPGGLGLHSWPGRYRPIESHLRMPGIQWLPRGAPLRAAILGWVLLGVEPHHFPGTGGLGLRSRSRIYHQWMLSATRYRSRREIEGVFQAYGFATIWGRGRTVAALTHEYLLTRKS